MEEKEIIRREPIHRNIMSRGSEAFMGSDEESWPHFLVNLPDQSKYSVVSQPKGFTGEHFQERDHEPITPLVNMRSG